MLEYSGYTGRAFENENRKINRLNNHRSQIHNNDKIDISICVHDSMNNIYLNTYI